MNPDRVSGRLTAYGLQGLRLGAWGLGLNLRFRFGRIADEGASRLTETEHCRFLEIAHGSARETCYLLSLCSELGFLAASVTDPLAQGFDEVAAGLHKLTTTLRRA
jgi:hypothetical protein